MKLRIVLDRRLGGGVEVWRVGSALFFRYREPMQAMFDRIRMALPYLR